MGFVIPPPDLCFFCNHFPKSYSRDYTPPNPKTQKSSLAKNQAAYMSDSNSIPIELPIHHITCGEGLQSIASKSPAHEPPTIDHQSSLGHHKPV